MPRPEMLNRVANWKLPPKRAISATMVAFVEVCKALNKTPHTRDELREFSGLSNNTVLSMLTLLQSRNLIFVAKWKRKSDRGNWMEAYAWGSEEDVPRPKAMTPRQYRERYMIRKQLKENENG